MKHISRILLLPVIALFGASCASTIESRIEKYPQKFASQSNAHKELIREGKIKEGMNKDGVYLAWGTPASVRQGSENGRDFESWSYVGQYPVYSDNLVYRTAHYEDRYGRHRHASYVDVVPTVNYLPYNKAEVEFSNGQVKKWDRMR